MRSTASLRGHPIHPALIPFPIAFLIGALAFDVAGYGLASPPLWRTAFYLNAAGIVTGLIAAVPGLIDYFWTVPPRSSGKRRATKHLLVNVTAIVLFALALLSRGGTSAEPMLSIVLLETAGAACLLTGGWLGGTLVFRNQIGVDGRYANAGQWTVRSLPDGRGSAVMVARADELETDQMMLVKIGGERVVVARTDDEYVAFDDRCAHRGGSLAAGTLICGTVQCPWHGSQYDVRTGRVVAGPAEQSIRTWQVRRLDGSLWLSPSPARPVADTEVPIGREQDIAGPRRDRVRQPQRDTADRPGKAGRGD
jgi:nitrite reductase/ring-hydroxylating ferredoxin subunit/uncharacterized membrane protein